MSKPAESPSVYLPQEQLFYREIVESYVRAERFLRRDWLAQEINSAMQEPACRFVLLTAEPGAGKSALMAQLCSEHDNWLRYFIRRDQRTPLEDVSAHSFLLRIGYQLAALRPELFSYDQIEINVRQRVGRARTGSQVTGVDIDHLLASPFYQNTLRIQQDVRSNQGILTGLKIGELVIEPRRIDLGDLQYMALLDPAQALLKSKPKEQIVILVDALDEIRYHGGENTILDWLINCPELPDNVRIVLTSRQPDNKAKTFIARQKPYLQRLSIASDDKRVGEDLRTYAQTLAHNEQVRKILEASEAGVAGFVEHAVEKADGNLGYLDALGRGIDQALAYEETQSALIELISLQNLPADLQELLAFFLQQVRSGPGSKDIKVQDPISGRSGLLEAWGEVYLPTLHLLAITLEPLSLDQIRALTGTLANRTAVSQALGWLNQFLDRIGDRYRLYHTTLAEFLTASETLENPETSGLYANAIDVHHHLAERLSLQLSNIWQEAPNDPGEQGRREYARAHLVEHLSLGQAWKRLFEVLDEGEYGQGKLRFDPSTYQYTRDLDLGREACIREGMDTAEALENLAGLWKYSLLRGTLASDADVFPPQTYHALALLGRETEALGLAQLVSDPSRQAAILGEIAAGLAHDRDKRDRSIELIVQALSSAGRILDSGERYTTLVNLLGLCQDMLEIGKVSDEQIIDGVFQLAYSLEEGANKRNGLRQSAVYSSKAGYLDAASQTILGIDRSIDEIEDPVEREQALEELSKAYADCEMFESALQAVERIEYIEMWLPAMGYLGAAYYLAGEVDATEQVFAQAYDSIKTAQEPLDQAMARILLAESIYASGETALGSGLFEEAYALLEVLDLASLKTEWLLTLTRGLHEAGNQEAVSRLLEEVKQREIDSLQQREIKPGHGYSLSIQSIDAAVAMADMGFWRMALEIAAALQPYERYSILEAVVQAQVRERAWDEAYATVSEIEGTRQSSPVQFTLVQRSSNSGDDAQTRGLNTIVSGLAAEKEWAMATQIAEKIQAIAGHCYGMSTIAIEQMRAGEETRAQETINQLKQYVRLRHAESGKVQALRDTGELILSAPKREPAGEVIEEIENTYRIPFSKSRLGRYLIESGEYKEAGKLIDRIDTAEERGQLRIRLAEELTKLGKSEAAINLLEQAIEDANQMDNMQPGWNLLQPIGLALFEQGEKQKAVKTLFAAVEALNNYGQRFSYSPSPWSSIVVDFEKVGLRDTALKISRGLIGHDAFDGCTGLLNLAKQAWENGDHEHARQLVDEAFENVASISFPPMQAGMQASIAAEYARMGSLEKALDERLATNLSQDEIYAKVAEELAKQSKAEEAQALLNKVKTGSSLRYAQVEIVRAHLRDDNISAALESAHRIIEEDKKASTLVEIAERLFSLERGDEALELLREAREITLAINNFMTVVRIKTDIVRMLVQAGYEDQAIHVIQEEWRGAQSRTELLNLLPTAKPMTALRPTLGKEIYTSFSWLEDFLKGV